MTAPSPSGATLGTGFKLLAKAILQIAQQLKIANQLAAIRLNNKELWATPDDLPEYRTIRRELGLTE